MAVNYKEVKEVLETAPLNDEELAVISHIEKWIDEKIVSSFDGGYISFTTELIDLKWNPDRPSEWNAYGNFKMTRKALMKKELMSRFENAGWKWELEQGEDDGPNRPAIDYWHLMGDL